MIKLLIVADDFTGALDTGVQFSKNDVKTMVTTNFSINFAEIESDIEVLVVNTETRHSDMKTAYERVFRVVSNAIAYGVQYFYKKTDSILRGNIGAELTALLQACNIEQLCFIPAFPQINRTTENGCQLIDGLPLDQTDQANDPFEPVLTCNISSIIAQQSNINVRIVDRFGYNGAFGGEPKVPEIVLFDAASEDDLLQIGRILQSVNRLNVIAGCAGFAEALLTFMSFENKQISLKKQRKITLIISGSLNNVSIEQLNYAQSHGIAGYTLSCGQKLNKEYMSSKSGEQLVREISDRLSMDGRFIINVVTERLEIDEAKKYALQHGISIESLHIQIAKNVGVMVKKVLENIKVDALVVFGGDTLLGIMETLGCDGITPSEEILPGVVISDVVSNRYSFQVVSKAGSFGEKDVVFKILSYFN